MGRRSKLYKLHIKKNKTIQLKMGRGPEYTFFQRRRITTASNRHTRRSEHHWSSGNTQNKSQWDIISPSCQKDSHQKGEEYQVPVRTWGKRALVQCWQESKLEQPRWEQHRGSSNSQKRGRSARSSKATSGSLPKENETRFQTDFWALMFIVVLFTILMIQKQSKCPLILINEWIKKRQKWQVQWNIVSHKKKKCNLAICNNMDGYRGYYTEEISQPEKDKYCVCVCFHVKVKPKQEGEINS